VKKVPEHSEKISLPKKISNSRGIVKKE